MATGQVPLVVDQGKVGSKAIKQLKRGVGKLPGEVSEVIEQVRAQLGADAAGKDLVPVVLVYKVKRKRKGGRLFG